jgi:hypothetical protein
MNPHQQYAAALAVAVGRLVESPAPGEPQKTAVKALLALAQQRSITFRFYDGVLTSDDETITDEVPGAEFLRRRFTMHGLRELVVARGAEADEVLAVVRGLAAEAGHGRIKEKLRDASSQKVMVIQEGREPGGAQQRPKSVSAAFAKVELDDAALAEWNKFLQHGAKREATFDAGLAEQGEATVEGAETAAAPAAPAPAPETPAQPAPEEPPPPPRAPLAQPPTLQAASPMGIALAAVLRDPYGSDILTRLTQLTRHIHDALKADTVAEVIDVLNTLVDLEAKAPEGTKGSYVATFNRIFNGAMVMQIVPYLLEPRRANRAAVVLRRAGGPAMDALVGLIGSSQSLTERVAYFGVVRGVTRATERVLGLLHRQEWQTVRNVAELVGEARIEEGITQLAALLDHADARVVRAAAIALGRIGTTATLEPLRRVFKEGAPELRAAVAAGIGGEQARALTAPLLALAESEPNADVAKAYLKALGRIGTTAAVQALQKAAEPGGKLLGRKPAHLRLGAVEGLKLARAAAALQGLAQDPDKAVREAAAQALASLPKA